MPSSVAAMPEHTNLQHHNAASSCGNRDKHDETHVTMPSNVAATVDYINR
jgi:hypothetical protein